MGINYVDDLLISGSDESMTDDLRSVLKSYFKLKYLGTCSGFLG